MKHRKKKEKTPQSSSISFPSYTFVIQLFVQHHNWMSVWLSGFPDGVFRELCECARICSESMHAQFCAHNQWWCSPRTDEHFFRPNQIHRYWIMIMLFVCAANANAVHCGAIRASWIKCYIVMYICMLLSSNCFRFHTYTHSTNRCKTQRSILEQFACLAWWSCCAQMKFPLQNHIVRGSAQSRLQSYHQFIFALHSEGGSRLFIRFCVSDGWPTGHVWWILFVASVFRCGAA